ncbi:hypothetical protein DOE73_29120 [Paenibacillus dendritiformis]|nr:hypothetical protein DOE73_29120 [Paenibacillus dendritiformis]
MMQKCSFLIDTDMQKRESCKFTGISVIIAWNRDILSKRMHICRNPLQYTLYWHKKMHFCRIAAGVDGATEK